MSNAREWYNYLRGLIKPNYLSCISSNFHCEWNPTEAHNTGYVKFHKGIKREATPMVLSFFFAPIAPFQS